MDTDIELPVKPEDATYVVDDKLADPGGSEQRQPDERRSDDDEDLLSAKVRKKIDKLTVRAKSAEERWEAERQQRAAAEQRAAEMERRYQQASEAGHGAMEQRVDSVEKAARDQLRRAVADGDIEGQIAATEALADAKAHRIALATQPRQQPQPRQANDQPARQAQPDNSAARAWVKENAWFEDDPRKKREALEIDRELAEEGYQPGSRAYFKELTSRTRHLAEDEDDQPARPQAGGGGSGVSRTTGPSRNPPTKIRLTAEQVEAARDMGITPERYAASLIALKASGKYDERRR